MPDQPNNTLDTLTITININTSVPNISFNTLFEVADNRTTTGDNNSSESNT